MKRNELKKVHKGDLLILVPKKSIDDHTIISTLKPLLWSHKNLGFKIFGKLNIGVVIALYLREHPHVQKRATVVDFTNPDKYSDKLETVLMSSDGAKVMAIAHKYLDTLKERYKGRYSYFRADTGWDHNTRDYLSIVPMRNYQPISKKSIGTVITTWSRSDVHYYEDEVCRILKCEKNDREFSIAINELPLSRILPIPPLDKKLTLREESTELTIEDNHRYVSMWTSVHKIIVPISWRALTAFMIDVHAIKDYSKVRYNLEGFSSVFKDSLYKDERSAGNNVMSIHKALTKLLGTKTHGTHPWQELAKKFPSLNKLMIDVKNDENGSCKQYVHIQGVDMHWNTLFTKKRLLMINSDCEITNAKQIVHDLA